jgi:hypothetical protein
MGTRPEYAQTQNNLGNEYKCLAEVREREINAQNAINSYQKALEVFTVAKYPYQYAQTQNDLKNAAGLQIKK